MCVCMSEMRGKREGERERERERKGGGEERGRYLPGVYMVIEMQ